MTIAGDGGLRVDGPACRPSRFGLLSVADVTVDTSEEWAKGLEWDELPCDYEPGTVSGQCPALPEQLKLIARGHGTLYADPFAVYAGWGCSVGGGDVDSAWDNADALLTRKWGWALERAFWSGLDQDGNVIRTSLAGSVQEDLTPGGGAVEIIEGLGLLENFAASCGGCEPIVHAPRLLVPYLAGRGLLTSDAEHTRFVGTGSLLSAGGGYDFTGPLVEESDEDPEPTPAVAGEAWLYVSGGVSIRHGETFFTPERGDRGGAVDRSVNDVAVYAERFAAFQVGCCVGAVQVQINPCCGAS